jgi:hypothetical protein
VNHEQVQGRFRNGCPASTYQCNRSGQWCGEHSRRRFSAAPYPLLREPVLLPDDIRSKPFTVAKHAGTIRCCGSRDWRPGGWNDCAVRFGADPRPRHTRGHRSNPFRKEQDIAESCSPQAARLGNRNRQWRPFWSGRPDHHDRRSDRFAHCSIFPPIEWRTEGAPGSGRSRRHDRRVRHTGCSSAARRRAFAVRTAASQPSAGRHRVCRGRLHPAAAVGQRTFVSAAYVAARPYGFRWVGNRGIDRRRVVVGIVHVPLQSRGSVRQVADPLDVVARMGRNTGRNRRIFSAAHARCRI